MSLAKSRSWRPGFKASSVVFYLVSESALLTQKYLKDGSLILAVPAGKVEIGESIEDAMIRELHEELNISPRSYCILGRIESSDQQVAETIVAVVEYKGDVFNNEPHKQIDLRFMNEEDVIESLKSVEFVTSSTLVVLTIHAVRFRWIDLLSTLREIDHEIVDIILPEHLDGGCHA